MQRDWILPFVVSVSVFLILGILSIQKPMTGDEVYRLEEIRGYAGGTYKEIQVLGQSLTFNHLPLYELFLSFLIHLFGENLYLLRSVGIVALCVSLFLLSFFPFLILPDLSWARRVSWIAPLLLATHPISVQGSVILEYESTLFLIFFSLFCFSWMDLPLSKGSFGGLSALYALCLWSRTTTALILPASWAVWLIFARPQKKEALSLLFILTGGIFLFLISGELFIFFFWGPEHFLTPFAYLFGRARAASPLIHGSWEDPLQDSARLLIWFGIPWLILFIAALWKKVPESLSLYRDRLCFLKIVVLFGIPIYYGVGGTTWGFPKYHTSFIPIATFLLVVFVTEDWPSFTRKEITLFSLLSGLFILFSFLFIGDPLYQLCYVLKKSFVLGSTLSQELPRLFRIFTLPLFFLLIALLWVTLGVKKKMGLLSSWALGCLLTAFSTQTPVAYIQARAPYPTASFYGEEGRKQVVEVLKKRIYPTDFILAPELIIYYETGNKIKFLGSFPWKNPSSFLEVLRQRSPKAVVYSIPTLSINSYRNVIQNQEVQRALRRNFFSLVFGDYTLWLRRGAT